MQFDPLVEKYLGNYVYALIDPRCGSIFYIGKGGGNLNAGNRRVLDHLAEASEAVAGKRPHTAKTLRIAEILSDGHEVVWKVIRRGLASVEQAHEVEAVAIDLLQSVGISLTNSVRGHGSQDSGLISSEQVLAKAAPAFSATGLNQSLIGVPIFLFNIAAAAQQGATMQDAVSGHWIMSRKFSKLTDFVVVGLVDGVSRVSYRAARWLHSPVRPRAFVAECRDEIKDLTYINFHSILSACGGFWKRGGFVVFQVTDARDLAMFRGKSRISIESDK